MHRTSRAPELSATLSRLSCWINTVSLARSLCSLRHNLKPSSLGSFEYFHYPPALEFRDRAGISDADAVALARIVGLVVRVQLAGPLQRLAVPAVAHAVDDRNEDGLVHLRGH